MPRISRLPKDAVAQWATENVALHPKDFTTVLARRFGVTRAAAAAAVKRLEAEGYVKRSRASTRPLFSAGPARWLSRRYSLPEVDEQLLWERDFLPWIAAPGNVRNILHHGFTEIVNNANDHSGGRQVRIEFYADSEVLSLIVTDDGVGVFRKIADTLALPDPRLSLLELANSFSKTVVPVKLASFGSDNLLSRSQAKRLVSRIDQFKIVELDFDEVTEIGQAFADEVFRVFARAHPEVQLIPKNTSPYVDGMIRRVLGSP